MKNEQWILTGSTNGSIHKTFGQIIRERYGGEEVPWMVPVRISLETPDEELGRVPDKEGTDA